MQAREQVRATDKNECTASVTSASQPRGPYKANFKFNGKCNYCKKPGHKVADCKKLKAKNLNGNNSVERGVHGEN